MSHFIAPKDERGFNLSKFGENSKIWGNFLSFRILDYIASEKMGKDEKDGRLETLIISMSFFSFG